MDGRWCVVCGASVPEGALRCPRCLAPYSGEQWSEGAYKGTDYEDFLPVPEGQGSLRHRLHLPAPTRRTLGAIIGLVAATLLVVALLTNAWFNIHKVDTWGEEPYREVTMDYGVSEVSMEVRERESVGWLVLETTVDYERFTEDEDHVKAAGWTELLGYHGLIFTLAFVVFSFHIGRGWYSPSSDRTRRLLPMLLGSVATALLVVAVAIFGLGFPEDAVDYFHYTLYGRPDSTSLRSSFYLAAVAALLLALATALSIERAPRPSGGSLPYSPAPPSQGAVTEGRGPSSYRVLGGALLGVIAICLLLTSMVGTDWYNVEAYRAPEERYAAEVEMDSDFGLYSVETKMDISSVFMENALMEELEYEEFAQDELFARVAGSTFLLMVASVLVALLFVAMALHSGTGRFRSRPSTARSLPFLLAYIAVALLLVAFLYFVIGFPEAALKEFERDPMVTVEYSAFGSSVLLALASILLLLIGGILAIGSRPTSLPP